MRALNFADTAPAWEELQAMVEAKQQELNAVPADLETVGGQMWRTVAECGGSGLFH